MRKFRPTISSGSVIVALAAALVLGPQPASAQGRRTHRGGGWTTIYSSGDGRLATRSPGVARERIAPPQAPGGITMTRNRPAARANPRVRPRFNP